MDIRWTKRINSAYEIANARIQGFDAVEASLSALMELDEAGLAVYRTMLKESKLPCEVIESILPPEVRVTERGFNIYSWTEYLRLALARASMLGCKTLVWGDGDARILPVEGETSILKEHFNQFLFMLCDIAERHEITVCVEPLGPRRTNFLNSLPEVVEAIDSIGKPNLAIALGSADIAEIGIQDEELSQYGKLIIHARVEKRRNQSGCAEGGPAAETIDGFPFLASLKKIAFHGTITLPGFSDGDMLRRCREAWKA